MPMTYQEITAVLYSLKAGDTVEITYPVSNNQFAMVTHVVDQSWEGMQHMFSETDALFKHPITTLCAKDGSKINVLDWQNNRYEGGVIRDFGDAVWWTPMLGTTAKPISYLKKM